MDQSSSAYARDLSNDNMAQSSSDYARNLSDKVNIMGDAIACVIPTIGFLAMFVVTTSYSIGWLKQRKGIVFNLIELSYLLYIFGAIWPYANGKHASLVLLRVTSSDTSLSFSIQVLIEMVGNQVPISSGLECGKCGLTFS